VARSAPDGNTWVLVFDTHAVNPALIPNMGFDTERDLTPLLLFGTAPMVLTAHRTRPWRSFAEMEAAARARPDTLTYGTIGNGSLAHLTMALVGRASGCSWCTCPIAAAGRSRSRRWPGRSTCRSRRGRRSARISTAAPSSRWRRPARRGRPPCPTCRRWRKPACRHRCARLLGLPRSAGLPAPVKARMEGALRGALDQPELRGRVTGLGIDLDPQGEEGFARFLSAQIATWGRVVRENNIRPD
jgi:tripartite-type tricarboxylate transporter receptor subunit TctC